MITIFSIESDQSTNHVIDWLDRFNAKWKRINAECFETKNGLLFTDNEKCYEKSDVIWFRKWDKAVNKISFDTTDSYTEINKGKEFDEYSKYLFYQYCTSFWLNNPDNISIDKLTQLQVARKIGLQIPPTILTSDKTDLIEFHNKHKNIITKNLAANLFKIKNEEAYLSYTQKVSIKDIQSLAATFYPSLFQKEIYKEYEIRTFYLDKEFYSMAIFSQNDPETKTDFRQYNIKNPNRNIPFKLPNCIENKIHQLMMVLKINSGSIDLIKNIEGEYIFLEINPLGQFGMTSYPCNYNLEKRIAEYLIEKKNQSERNKN